MGILIEFNFSFFYSLFEQFKGGENKGTTTITTQNVNSNLNFSGDLALNAGKELNVKEATISSQNINQEGLDTSKITTKEVKKEDVKPQYGDIAKGAAITGLIAGGTIVASELIVDKFGKPTMETSKGDALRKPSDKLLKKPEFQSKYPNYDGSTSIIDKTRPNMGIANTTDDINKVFQTIKPLNPFKEGSLIMGGIEKNIGGMHGVSMGHDPFVHSVMQPINKALDSTFQPFISQSLSTIIEIPVNQGTILPFILGTYCVQVPTACAGVTGGIFGDRPK